MRHALSIVGVLASVWLAVLAVILSVQATEQPLYSSPAVAGATTYVSSDAQPLTNILNQTRQDAAVVPVTEDSRLMDLAKMRAKDMVDRQYYAHQTPEGNNFADFLNTVGLHSDLTSCENLLLTTVNQPYSMIGEWLASPAHRACMLDENMTRVGVASVDYGDGFQLAVTIFAADQ